jgi:hypothetical protein
MTPLLFAAALAIAPPVAQPGPAPDLHFAFSATRTLGPDPTAACARLANQTVAPDGVPLKKLGELPPALLEHAVWRRVGGCPVREIVFGGQTYYLQGSGPKVVRLDPDAGQIQRRDAH